MTDVADTKLYIVKLRTREEALSFYDDMETPGGNLYIPDRAVASDFTNHKTLFVKYRLTEQEAAQVALDPRVDSITLDDSELPVIREPLWIQTANFWRGTYTSGSTTSGGPTGTYDSNDKNWGLVKITEGKNYFTIPSTSPDFKWGSDNGLFRRLPWTVGTKFDGRNVDVVIVDGHLRPNHAEFAKNPDGSGGTRFVNYPWFQHAVNDPTNTDLTKVHHPAAVGQTYDYTANDTDAGDHGSHCAATVAGNTQGWARRANIYNISIFEDGTTYNMSEHVYDYIRAFHASKPINLDTGRKNPTIVNASVGSYWLLLPAWMSSVTYRGTTLTGTFTTTNQINVSGTNYNLTDYGFGKNSYDSSNGRYKIPRNFDAALMADVDALCDDGVIFCAAAGNDNWTQELPTDPGWNTTYIDWFYITSYRTYHSRRGGAQTEKTINVAAAHMDAYEYLASYSNRGNAITIVSPGTGIISAVSNTQPGIYSGGVAVGTRVLDPRGLNFDRLEPYQGTSMATPQVAGVLALLSEINPDLNNVTSKTYLAAHAKTGQLNDFAAGTPNYQNFALKNTINRYVFLPQHTITVITSGDIADKSDTITYTINTVNLPANSILYWNITGTGNVADFTNPALKGTVTIASTSATVTKTIAATATYGNTFTMTFRSGGYTGNIQATAKTVTISPPPTSTTTTTTASGGTGSSSTTTTTTVSSGSSSTTTTTTASGGTGSSSTTTTTTISGGTGSSTSTTTTTSTSTTTASGSNPIYIKFDKTTGEDDCCNKDKWSIGYNLFKFKSGIPLGSTTTSTTTVDETPKSTTTSTSTTQPPFYPILDLVDKKKTTRKFIVRLRKTSTGPVVANSKIITVSNMPADTLLPAVFTNPLLKDRISTKVNLAYYQKTVATIPASIRSLTQECYDDRSFVLVTGNIEGNVYGGGNYYGTITAYSEDSNLNAAVVHAGLVLSGQSAYVRRHLISYYKEVSRPSFYGDTRNGVTTMTRLEGCGFYFDPSATILITTTLPPGIPCDVPVTPIAGGQQFPSIHKIILGSSLGKVTFNFEAFTAPDRFVVYYPKTNPTPVIDTGYRGSQEQLTRLRDALGDPSVIITSPGAGTADFNKTLPYTEAEVRVYAPLPGTGWQFTLSCPDPNTTTTTTTSTTTTSTTTTSTTTTTTAAPGSSSTTTTSTSTSSTTTTTTSALPPAVVITLSNDSISEGGWPTINFLSPLPAYLSKLTLTFDAAVAVGTAFCANITGVSIRDINNAATIGTFQNTTIADAIIDLGNSSMTVLTLKDLINVLYLHYLGRFPENTSVVDGLITQYQGHKSLATLDNGIKNSVENQGYNTALRQITGTVPADRIVEKFLIAVPDMRYEGTETGSINVSLTDCLSPVVASKAFSIVDATAAFGALPWPYVAAHFLNCANASNIKLTFAVIGGPSTWVGTQVTVVTYTPVDYYENGLFPLPAGSTVINNRVTISAGQPAPSTNSYELQFTLNIDLSGLAAGNNYFIGLQGRIDGVLLTQTAGIRIETDGSC